MVLFLPFLQVFPLRALAVVVVVLLLRSCAWSEAEQHYVQLGQESCHQLQLQQL